MEQRTVALAFSGGLDTSFCVVHLRDQGWRVITVTVDTGGFSADALATIETRAHDLGSAKHVVVDARSRLYSEFVAYLIKGDYLRNHAYPSCTGAERIVVAEEVTNVALQERADAVAHGSTGAGNDHVRFDTVILAIAPHMDIVTPIRDEGFTREHETDFLRQRGISVDPRVSTYSINQGMLGVTIGGKETKGSWEYLPNEAWVTTAGVDEAPPGPQDLVIHFEHGMPDTVSRVDAAGTAEGQPSYSGVDALTHLNELGAKHGVGRGTHLGTTIMGIPGRIGFEAPGLSILIAAHRELERLTLTSRQQSLVTQLGTLYGDMLHEGMYGDPAARDIEAFLDSVSRRVVGDVRVRLHRGSSIILGARSPFSLLDSSRRLGGVYGQGSALWTGAEARAFAKLYATPSIIASDALRHGTGKMPDGARTSPEPLPARPT